MDRNRDNKHVKHPDSLIEKDIKGINRVNNNLALSITTKVGSMWSAYLFGLLSLTSLPAILVTINPSLRNFFPSWIINTSMITLIAWISQNFLQLVLLPVIMVGQNVIQGRQNAKAQTDHQTLTYLANTQEEQLEKLENITKELQNLKNYR
jgi:hypothetical protein